MDYLKQYTLNSILECAVECKLTLWQQSAPLIQHTATIASKHLFHTPVKALSQPIRLWMVSCGQGNTWTKQSKQLLPKSTSKLNISIANYFTRQPKSTNPMLKEQLCTLYCCHTAITWNKSNKTRKSIYYSEDCIKPTWTNRKVGDEVHCNMFKWTLWVFKRLQ